MPTFGAKCERDTVCRKALAAGWPIVVPYCVEGELELFHLESMDELERGAYRVLEPHTDLRMIPEKRIPIEQLGKHPCWSASARTC